MKTNIVKSLVYIVILSVSPGLLSAQSIGEVEFKTGRASGHMNPKKIKKADKKIYIAEFFINYQLLYSKSEVARGGRELGGGYRGDAKASLILGVPGIDPDRLQANTDRLYQEYVDQLKSEGYEIVNADAAEGAESIAEWQKLTGGTISEAQNPGYLFTAPTGFDYFVKKINKKGRAKTGMMDYTLKLSRDMGAVIVARINLILPIAEDAESGASKGLTKSLGGVAKIVARPSYRVSPSEGVQTGKMSGTSVSSLARYTWMKSMGDQAALNFSLKKPIAIDGVFEDKKYKAVESADQDLWGSQMGALTIFRVDDKEVQRMQALECDPDQFVNGAYEASRAMVTQSIDGFLSFME